MTDTEFDPPAAPACPEKPRPDFPLFPHACGKWAKKINGKTRYFGRWNDPEGALAQFEAFRQPAIEPTIGIRERTLTVEDACSLFLASKESQLESEEISLVTFKEYVRTCKRLAEFFGREAPIESLMPADFARLKSERAKKNNIVTVGNEITRVKTVLKWLRASKHTGEIETGPDFRKPSQLATRRHRRQRGKMMFSAEEVRAIIDECGLQMRAMMLLAMNTGFQNSDMEQVTLEIVQESIETGWIEFPRLKTEMERRCPLWPATRKALRIAMKRRPKSDLPNAFLRRDGKPLSSGNHDLGKHFRAIRDHALIRRGGFSWLRKTFETVGGASKDQVAVNYIMGHVDPSMGAVYRQEVWDERLIAVTDVVRCWLTKKGGP